MKKAMTNEKIISESQSLYSDIDCCITELLKARTEHNSENEGKALFKMEGLMVSALQYLSWIKSGLPSNPTLTGRPTNEVGGIVRHFLNAHWIETNKKQLATILKEFPEGAEVELFICAKREEE